MAIRRPVERDFEVVCQESTVEVTFKPTSSLYTFNVLVEQKDIARWGPLSLGYSVRHAGVTGDTGEYPPSEVVYMARRLAERELLAFRRSSRT